MKFTKQAQQPVAAPPPLPPFWGCWTYTGWKREPEMEINPHDSQIEKEREQSKLTCCCIPFWG